MLRRLTLPDVVNEYGRDRSVPGFVRTVIPALGRVDGCVMNTWSMPGLTTVAPCRATIR